MLCPLRLDIDPLSEGSPQWWIDEALVKKHCRVDFSDEDAGLHLYLRAAIEWAENVTHRTIFQREHRWVLREFPGGRFPEIRLPRGKTVSVDSIQYYSGGTAYDLIGPSSSSPAGTGYQEDLRSDEGGVLIPPRGGTWPSIDTDVPAPVTVTFTAGWAAGEIPAQLLQAILLATADGYDLRSSGDLAGQGANLNARNALVSGFHLSRWY